MKAWITTMRDAFPDINLIGEQSIVSGDMVAVLSCWRGTHDGPFSGIEPPAER